MKRFVLVQGEASWEPTGSESRGAVGLNYAGPEEMLSYRVNEYADPGFQKGFLSALQLSRRVSEVFLKLYAFLQRFGGVRSWVQNTG